MSELDVEKLAQRVGVSPEEARDLLVRFGPIQRWVLERLSLDADADPWPPWISLSDLTAEYAGGQPSRRQVESVRRACTRLASVGMVELSQRWMEREGEPPQLPWLRRESTIRRRHLCVRLPLAPAQRERWEEAQRELQGQRRGRARRSRRGQRSRATWKRASQTE